MLDEAQRMSQLNELHRQEMVYLSQLVESQQTEAFLRSEGKALEASHQYETITRGLEQELKQIRDRIAST